MGIRNRIKAVISNIFAKPSIYFQGSSYPSAGLDATTLADIFRSADNGDVLRQSELFEEMEEKDTHLTSVLQTRKLAVSGLEWELTADEKNQKIVEFVSEKIKKIQGFNAFINDSLDAIGKGFSVGEIIYAFNKGAAEIKKIERVDQKRFTFTGEDGTILRVPHLLTEENMSYGIKLPEYKFIYCKYNARSGIAPRGGLLRPIAWMYLFKNYSLKDWVIFNERYAMPSRIGKYKAGSSKEDIEALEKAVRRIGSDAAAVISDNTVIDLVESKARGDIGAYEKLCSYADNQISKAVLGQTLTTDTGASGSYAQAKVHNTVRADILKADMKVMANTITEQLIKPLITINFGANVPTPKFEFKLADRTDLKVDSEILKNLRQAGFGDIPVVYIHKHYSIPIPAAGEKTIGPMPSAAPIKASAMKDIIIPGESSNNEKRNQLLFLQKAMDNNTEKAMGEILAPVFALASESASLEELRNKLDIVYDSCNDNQIDSILNNAIYLAQIWGRLSSSLLK